MFFPGDKFADGVAMTPVFMVAIEFSKYNVTCVAYF
jgi:hypothetical protein